MIESPYDEPLVRAQVDQILGNPSDQEARELAYSVAANQFEDVIAESYITVIIALRCLRRLRATRLGR
jgi:hypothetical protein